MPNIRTQISNMNAMERATAKGQEIAKVARRIYNRVSFDIEIVDTKAIEGGVSVYARVWKGGKQIGFGRDGSVEIERFNIYNPPIMVQDDSGDYVLVREANEDLGLPQKETRYREDPQEALLQVIEHNLSVMKNIHDDKKIVRGKVGRTTSTFYPSMDGSVARILSSCSGGWSGIRDGAGTSEDDTSASVVGLLLQSHVCNSPDWWRMDRFIVLFDTSALPDTDDIDSATYSVMNDGSASDGFGSMSADLVGSTPASNSVLATSDYGQLGSTRYATGIALSAWPATDVYANFTLNATGLSNISKTAITKFGMRLSNDTDNSAPTHPGTSQTAGLSAIRTSKTTGTTQDPKLVVEHSASATIVTPSTLSVTFSIPTYSVSGDAGISPTTLGITFSIPTYTPSAGVTVSPTTQTITFSIPLYAIQAGTNTQIVTTQSITFSIPSASVLTDNVQTVNTQVITFSIPTYTPSLGVTETPDTLAITFSIPTSSVLLGQVVEPSTQSITFSIPTYTVVAETRVSVTTQAITFSIPTATVVFGVSVSPDTQAITFSIPTLADVGGLWRKNASQHASGSWTKQEMTP